MADKEIESELEKKYTELQFISQQMKQIQNQLLLLNNQIQELTHLQQSMTEFKELKDGTEIKISIGSGIYADAILKSNNSLLVNVGAGVVVKKDIESTKR